MHRLPPVLEDAPMKSGSPSQRATGIQTLLPGLPKPPLTNVLEDNRQRLRR